jgi:hypothetical protein
MALFEEFVGKGVVVFYDDGAAQNNVKRKAGKLEEIREGFIVIAESDTGIKMMMPIDRIIRVELHNSL